MKEKILEKIQILIESKNNQIWIDVNSHYGLFIQKFADVDNQNMIIQLEIRKLISNETLDIFTLKTFESENVEDTVEYIVDKLQETEHTMRSAFKRWLLLHHEFEKNKGYVRIPNWFRHYLRKNHEWKYTISNYDKNYNYNIEDIEWNKKRKYKGFYTFFISDFELENLQRAEWIK